MNEWIRDYILLAYGIEQHLPGYIDAYFGPPDWKSEGEARGKQPLEQLAGQANRIAEQVAAAELEPQRRQFVNEQVAAMQTTLRMLGGERLALADEVEALYGLAPAWVDEFVFSEAHRALDELLPEGPGLAERMIRYRQMAEISVERAAPLFEWVRDQLQQRARVLFTLPESERFDLVMVKNQPWGAYNWFLGGARSRVDINTDLPVRVTSILGLIAHEGYPGHHTELSMKEAELVQRRGWLEHAIALINAPSCSISEGIANCALDTLMSEEEQIAFQAELFERAGVRLDARQAHQIRLAGNKLRVSGNGAFLVHERGASQDEVVAYYQRWALATAEEARKGVAFVSTPLYRSYIFNYTLGVDLLEELFRVKGDRRAWFERLLVEPVTPGLVKEWMR